MNITNSNDGSKEIGVEYIESLNDEDEDEDEEGDGEGEDVDLDDGKRKR